ncbi:thioesterase II family protein [Plantactinospora sp. DSM 117369]
MTRARPSRWLMIPEPRPAASVRMYCLPHAGGGASAYQGWTRTMPPFIEVCPVQLPGRENRFGEQPIDRLPELVDQIVAVISDTDQRPYVLFGHSLGAALSFETAVAMRDRCLRPPIHLVVSGFRGPRLRARRPRFSELPDHALIKAVARMGGLPPGAPLDDEYLTVMLPTLRTDLRIAEDYHSDAVADCPITALGGLDDQEVLPAELDAWRDATTAGCRVHHLPGGHFFLRDSARVTTMISDMVALTIELRRLSR